MKKIVFLAFALITSALINAQVSVGRTVSPTNLYINEIKEEHFDGLEKSTFFFVIPESLSFDDTKNEISKVWTYSKIEFVPEKDYKKEDYFKPYQSIIIPHSEVYTLKKGISKMDSRVVNEWYAFRFQMISYLDSEIEKDGDLSITTIHPAEIFFTQSIRHRYEMTPLYKEKKVADVADEPDFYNFQLGYIKNYIQILNKALTERKHIDLRDKFINAEKIKLLKDQTLYAPEWLLKRASAFTGRLSKIEKPDELFEKYKYTYELLNYDALNSKILSGDDFYYLMNTQFNEHQILSIINSLTGDIIYSFEDKSYNVSSKDIKNINEAIEKNSD
ncbi:MAG: hypothetical protein ACSHXF_15190 [Aquaticitalea sp.]